MGKAVESVAKHLGFDTNDAILTELADNMPLLGLIQEEFLGVLEKKAPSLVVYSFQEAKGLLGIQGLNKVVDDTSSRLDYRYEIVDSINASHRDMCRFDPSYGSEFFKIYRALSFYADLAEKQGSALVREPTKLLPFPRDPLFVGREAELSAIQTAIQGPGNPQDMCREAGVVGLGGVGKTQIALEFAYRLWERQLETSMDNRHSIFFVHASSHARVQASFESIADKLNLIRKSEYGSNEHINDVFYLVKDWLESDASGSWIFIWDNADDEDVFFGSFFSSRPLPNTPKSRKLCDFIPQKPNCAIIYTSRNRTCTQRLISRSHTGTTIAISPFSISDSITLIQNGLGPVLPNVSEQGVCDPIERIAAILDNIPLAIVQAAAFMKSNYLTPEEYLTLYEKMAAQEASLLQEEYTDWRRESGSNAIFLIWKCSFELSSTEGSRLRPSSHYHGRIRQTRDSNVDPRVRPRAQLSTTC